MARTESPAFGELLRRSRRALGLTQEELAERAGVSARLISALESDASHRPRKDTLRLLAEALELSAEEQTTFFAAVRQVAVPAAAPEMPHDQGGKTRSPPSSVQTFLVADIRGYTRFTQEHGDEAAAQLAMRFARLAEEVVTPWEGRVIETRGDEVLVAFASARGALQAAVALQTQLELARSADPSLPLRAGIGLDAGEAVPVGEGYRGGALNLAARLCSLAAAGEVFASEGVIHLARKTEGLVFVDRGEVRLKGLAKPIRVIQIAREGTLLEELPPLQPTLETRPTNLPDEPTPFIGREREIEQIAALLRDPHIRMVTLTGPGGTGKTRLALQIGAILLDVYRDGVFFVSLASLADPALVPSTIAEVLSVKEQAGTDLLETLIEYLTDRQPLLVLDNYEHLLEASSVVGALLDGCRELNVLITSRIPLRLAREHEYLVLPLAVPDPNQSLDLEHVSRYEAVALFVDRARAVKADFKLTKDNASVVAEICARLDGLPLAIVLAAVRIKVFPPQALLQRLSSRLKLLTGGAGDLPGRQQTLRAAIDWSYSLLSVAEQALFVRLSVFADGCTFEAAEAVCNVERDLKVEVLDGMASLVEKSLLRQEGENEPRFGMLETIREYVLEKLAERGEEESIKEAHARYFLQLAEAARQELTGPRQEEWLARLDTEHDNLHAALGWLLAGGQIEEELRLAIALNKFWERRGRWSERIRWLQEGLARSTGIAGGVRAQALSRLADGLLAHGEYELARQRLEEALLWAREVGDRREAGWTLRDLGWIMYAQGDVDHGKRRMAEGLQLLREVGDSWAVASALDWLGDVATESGEFGVGEAHYREALALYRQTGDLGHVANSLNNVGYVLVEQGKYAEADLLLQESLALSRRLGVKSNLPAVLDSLARLAWAQGDRERAGTLFAEGLAVGHELGDIWMVLIILGHMAELAVDQVEAERATTLFGAAAGLREGIGTPIQPAVSPLHDHHVAATKEALGEERFTAAWGEGRAMSLEQAVAYALGESR